MSVERYPAARAIATAVAAHFETHVDAARRRGVSRVASVPDAAAIETIVDVAFWTSLRREEGYSPRISLAFLSPDESTQPMRFERPLALSAKALTKLAPAVERAGIHLGVWPDAGGLSVWGTTASIPTLCFVLEVAAPGLLVIKHQRGEESGKYVNVAVLEGDVVKIVDETASSLPDCPPLLTSLLGFDSPASWIDRVNVLVQLAASMRAHRRGGLLLVVPPEQEGWGESIVQPIAYRISPAYDTLARLVRERPEAAERPPWQEAVSRAVDSIAGLTAVDGAVVMTADYRVLAFGAKIARRRGSPPVEQVSLTEPVEGGTAAIVHPSLLGGTRHLAAAQFIHDQREGLALVASQDGRFTVCAWSPCEGMVHAHRVEALLL